MPDLSITRAGSMAGGDAHERLRAAARGFEQQFVAQLMKPLGERSEASRDLFGDDPGASAFQGLMNDGLAEHAAGGLGIARIIEQALAQRLR